MRIFAANAMEIIVLGVGVLLLTIWSNHLRSSLSQLAEPFKQQNPAEDAPSSRDEQ